jgi:hypothetical protein
LRPANVKNIVAYINKAMDEIIEKKQKYENNIKSIFEVYVGKYIRKLYEYARDEKGFKKVLIDIASWDELKIAKEYNKFLKWVEKKHKSGEAEIKNILDNVIMYSIRLMVNKYDTEVIAKLIEFESTNPERFFYKCMKRASRYVYENPKSVLGNLNLESVIVSVIYEFLPIQKIIKLLEVTKEQESDKSYDFNKTFTSENGSDKESDVKSKKELIIDKETTSQELQYVASEDLINEYYDSDGESDKNNNEKLINVPMMKKKRM